MLNVFFGLDSNVTTINVDLYFNHIMEYEWLEEDIVKQMVEDVDGSIVLGPRCIESPVLGMISPEKLSGGVKALILLHKLEDFYIDLAVCGKNCEKWLLKIAEARDITCCNSSFELFKECDMLNVRCLNDDEILCSSSDWVSKCEKYISTSKGLNTPIKENTLFVYDSHIRYEITLRDKITVVRGNSGTGKTVLYNLLSQRLDYGEFSGISLESDLLIVLLYPSVDWKELLVNRSNCLIVCDGGMPFISDSEFIEYVGKSSNCFLFIGRSDILGSIGSVYELEISKGVTRLVKTGRE